MYEYEILYYYDDQMESDRGLVVGVNSMHEATQKLLDYYDGGIVHFCGRGDHYVEALCKIPKLYGINLSQPQYNDMETIYRNTVDRGIAILAFNAARAAEDEGRAGGFHHLLSIG